MSKLLTLLNNTKKLSLGLHSSKPRDVRSNLANIRIDRLHKGHNNTTPKTMEEITIKTKQKTEQNSEE